MDPNVAIIADVQLGNHKRFGGEVVGSINFRCRLILDVLAAAIDRIIEDRCTHLVVAGDLFDYVRPEAPLIARVQREFARFSCLADGYRNIILMRGNHDMVSTLEGDSALAPLTPYARIIDRPTRCALGDGAELLAVPFMPGAAKDWLPQTVHALLAASEERASGGDAPPLAPAARLLALHMGIKDEKTPPWLQSSPAAIDLADLVTIAELGGIDAIVAGDWHARQRWDIGEVDILQVGALVPTGWDNPGLTGYGTLAFWRPGEIKELTLEELPGPRFVKVKTSIERDELVKVMRKNTGRGSLRLQLFVSHEVPPEEVQATVEFWKNVYENMPLGGFEVVPDASLAKAEAQQAASIARSAETVQEALVAYVKNMPLADGVRRDAVLTRSRSYLK